MSFTGKMPPAIARYDIMYMNHFLYNRKKLLHMHLTFLEFGRI